MELMHQPFSGQLGERLIEFLDSKDFHTLNIAVAFAKNSGVLRIKDSLKGFRERGGKVNIYVGVDLGGTSYEALTTLLLHSDSLNVIHSESGQTFHVKIYQFLGKGRGLMVVGSHNLTGGGLWTNFESSALISIDNSSPLDAAIQDNFGDYIVKLRAVDGVLMPVSTQEDIDKLLKSGYVLREVSEQIRLAKIVKYSKTSEKLFGKGTPAKLPRISQPDSKAAKPTANGARVSVGTSLSGAGNTIWFETRKLTGGSRNILDLSKRSLVVAGDPKGTAFDIGEATYMRGALEFFGLNPEDTKETKDITLNFEGFDYYGNTILFPVGNHANGTWRLQIKGVSAAGKRITDAFRKKGEEHYLVKKIVTFNKITPDYYSISVFPENELEDFKASSSILARNGSNNTAKLLGVIKND